MPVLDSTFLVDFQRGHPGAEAAYEALVARRETLLVPAQVAIEFASGHPEPEVALHMLESSFRVVDVDREQVLAAARLARESRALGAFPGWADIQVAALAKLEATYVVTSNVRHFTGVGVDAWDPRAGTALP